MTPSPCLPCIRLPPSDLLYRKRQDSPRLNVNLRSACSRRVEYWRYSIQENKSQKPIILKKRQRRERQVDILRETHHPPAHILSLWKSVPGTIPPLCPDATSLSVSSIQIIKSDIMCSHVPNAGPRQPPGNMLHLAKLEKCSQPAKQDKDAGTPNCSRTMKLPHSSRACKKVPPPWGRPRGGSSPTSSPSDAGCRAPGWL